MLAEASRLEQLFLAFKKKKIARTGGDSPLRIIFITPKRKKLSGATRPRTL